MRTIPIPASNSVSIVRPGFIGLIAVFLFLFVPGMISPLQAQENDVCLTCHEDKDLSGMRGDKEISVFVDETKFSKSVHADLSCIDCHSDLEGVEDEHAEDVKPVNCASCHEDESSQLGFSPHGKGRRQLSCTVCHGYHDVSSPSDAGSLTN
ncbi:MAG: hypothetical protein GY940_16865, partial [bacterium]|nr:hypothetical protein [bacterium]